MKFSTVICMTSFTPFSERCEILNSVRVSNLAWLPSTVDSNYSERLWLHARTFLVALVNRVGWPGESNWKHTLPLLPLNHASAVAAKTPNTTLSPQRGQWNLAILYGWKPHNIWQISRHGGGRPIAKVLAALPQQAQTWFGWCGSQASMTNHIRGALSKSRLRHISNTWYYGIAISALRRLRILK